MLVDTHVHLYSDRYDADRQAVIARSKQAGVDVLLLPAVDLASIDAALALADAEPGVFAMAGLHPTYLADAGPGAFERVERVSLDARIVAIGETGLDYYWSRDHADLQRQSLDAHARLAVRRGLPVVLHNRDQNGSDDCARDIVRILRDVRETEEGGERLAGVFHCFGGPDWLAAEAMDLGFYVGLGGTLTFKKSGVADAVRDVPLDRIVLETDGPYLAPAPHRGQRNEPAYVPLVAQALADARGLDLEAVARQTTENALRLFRLADRVKEATRPGA